MLQITNLTKVFTLNGVEQKIALKNLDLSLKQGEFVTVIGGNGAGKSTLLNAIAGDFPVENGKIIIEDEEVTSQPSYLRAGFIGRVFQDPLLGTSSTMSIEENLILAFRRGEKKRLKKAIGQKERDFFRERLKILGLGLENRLSTPVGLLSGGQRQALTLLMATIKRPKILLLDEHTAALDPRTAARVLTLTCELIQDLNLTALMVTHNMEQALKVGERTIMMHEGKIILDLKGEERRTTSVTDLLKIFEKYSGTTLYEDRMLLI